MEDARVANPVQDVFAYKGNIADPSNHNREAVAENWNVSEGDHNGGRHAWEKSPERTPSLLPPFGATQPSHLPTPQSPGNMTGYVSDLTQSPLSLEHFGGPIRYSSTLRPPSHPSSVQPPKTPPHSLASSAKPPSSCTQGEQNDDCRHDIGKLNSRSHPSQVATPSPEVFRIGRSSIMKSPSNSFATPQPNRTSSSRPHVGTTPLAPAPFISPVNACNDSPQSRSLQHDTSAVEQVQYDRDDPFLVYHDDGRDIPVSNLSHRYRPPPTKHQLHRSIHADNSSPRNLQVEKQGPFKNPMARFVMSTNEMSDAPTESPVKTEVDDRDYDISMGMSRRSIVDDATFPGGQDSLRTSSLDASTTPSGLGSRISAPRDISKLSKGGEFVHIHQRYATTEESRLAESEKRRPEYLVRNKRFHGNDAYESEERERDNGLGVTNSPSRGRRLELFQREAMAKHLQEQQGLEPVDILETNIIPDASVQPTIPSMSLRAIDWRSPRRDRSSVVWREEDEIKKQKRLQAFLAPEVPGKGHRLKPVEIVGRGRVVIDITSKESQRLAAAGVLHVLEPPEKDSKENIESSLISGLGAEWPDNEYPWSAQEQQRDRYAEVGRRKRLAWIERFLDRESESEEENNECIAGPSTWNTIFDDFSAKESQTGRAKPIPLKSTSIDKRSESHRRPAFGAANADAREVLLSKKHVRALAERVRKKKLSEEEEGIVMCICQGGDDGRPMVRCDECRTWYHLVCMDIHDESELGDEWYCWKCLPSVEDSGPSAEPIFAPSMPESPPRVGVGDQPLYQSELQPSPMPPSPVARRKRDVSPIRSSRLPHLLGDPGDPVRGGPSTPYHPRSTDSRLYSSPKLYEEYGIDEMAPFDPTSTPSRGFKFPNSVSMTPRRPHTWNAGQSSLWTTPSGPPQTPQFLSVSGSSSTRSLANSLSTLEDSVGPLTSPMPMDESPTRRPRKSGDTAWPYPPRRVLNSPLAVRATDHRPFLPDVEDSPTPRRTFRGTGNEIGELTPRVRGRSPHSD